MKTVCCAKCNEKMTPDEVAFNLRIRGNGIGSFYCLPCLSILMDCETAVLVSKLKQLKEGGCSFFSSMED